ncbi:hypothetical protein CKO25_14360 [Thiocapsa imhoffii]|uniref:Uncharacterized protein n=1 Tax=Thiocapsa imhoffii TaxID=382777 RepID=A0A9X1BA73_9GAMM|nr:hypothetical protein [Thiocapsa imhoffii]
MKAGSKLNFKLLPHWAANVCQQRSQIREQVQLLSCLVIWNVLRIRLGNVLTDNKTDIAFRIFLISCKPAEVVFECIGLHHPIVSTSNAHHAFLTESNTLCQGFAIMK